MEPLRYCHRKSYLIQASGLKALAQGHFYSSFNLCISLPLSLPVHPDQLLLRAACFSSPTLQVRWPNPDNCTLSILSFSFFLPWSLKTSARPISNDNLHTLPRFQRRPIYLLVFQGSHGNLILVVGFTLRCFQRLSRPYFASQLCPWQDNCCTSGTSTPVLSY